MAQPQRQATKPMLALAAESIALKQGQVSGIDATVVDVLHGRALRHYAEGLRQYLILRLGTEEEATSAISELRAIVATWTSETLVAPPGARANLYRLARDIAGRRRAGRVAAPAQSPTLPWRRPASPIVAPGYLEGLARVRTDPEAELLELRFARELAPEEVAHVIGEPIEAVNQRLDAATARAQTVLGPNPPSTLPGINGAILEAFALEPSKSAGAAAAAGDGAAEEREPLDPGTVVGGRYAIEKRVGMGAFGDVYRANDTEVPGHVVALKLLHQTAYNEEARAVALRELRLIASVFHPSVVQFKDHGWFEGRLWFVMPWYEGETLESRIQREPLTRAEARRIFEPLARALGTIHAAGIRHQDVKPDNIFLARIRGFGLRDEDHEVLPVLLDLGVAAKEAEMVVAGTPTYFAPEVAAQFANVETKSTVTSKADVFSLALSLRNALEPETQEDVPAGAIESFIEHRATHVPAAPTAKDLRFLRGRLDRWMALEPADRPTADQLADELAVLTAPEERRKRIVGTLKWLGPLVAAALLVFGATAYALQQRAERQAAETREARREAAAIRGELGMETERRQRLQEEADELREEYESSTLSRQELAGQLAQTEARLRAARQDLGEFQERVRTLRGELGASQEKVAALERDLTATRDRLTQTAARLAGAESELEGARREIAELRSEVDVARQQLAQTAAQLDSTRAQLNAERARATTLEQALSEAQSSRARAESDLEAARRRISELERELAAERARNRAPPPPAGGGGAAPAAPPEGGTGSVPPPPATPPPATPEGIQVIPGPGVQPTTPTQPVIRGRRRWQ